MKIYLKKAPFSLFLFFCSLAILLNKENKRSLASDESWFFGEILALLSVIQAFIEIQSTSLRDNGSSAPLGTDA